MFGQDCRTEWVAELKGSQFTSHNENDSFPRSRGIKTLPKARVNTFRRLISTRLEYLIPELAKLVLGNSQTAQLKGSLLLNLSRILELNTKDATIFCAIHSACPSYMNSRALPKEESKIKPLRQWASPVKFPEVEQQLQKCLLKLRDLAKNGKVKITMWKGGSSGYQTRRNNLNSKDNIRKLTLHLKIIPDLDPRRRLLSQMSLTHDCRLFNISTWCSKICSTMSQYSHEHYHAIVTINPTTSSSSCSRRPPQPRSPSLTHHHLPPSSRCHSPLPLRNLSPRWYSPPSGPCSRHLPSLPNMALCTIQGRNMPNVPGVRIIHTLEPCCIIQDMDTGISVLIPVMQVSSSQTGLKLLALMQLSDSEGWSCVPHSIEGSHESSCAYYHPHPPSPPHECLPQQQSPPLIHHHSPLPLPHHHPSTSRCSSPPATTSLAPQPQAHLWQCPRSQTYGTRPSTNLGRSFYECHSLAPSCQRQQVLPIFLQTRNE